jgi:hypothetical protein
MLDMLGYGHQAVDVHPKAGQISQIVLHQPA